MYHRLLSICRVSACRTSNKLEIARRLCQKTNIAVDNTADNAVVKSETFPDYKVIYIFRYARIARIVNGLKGKFCAMTLAATPIGAALYYSSMISGKEAVIAPAIMAMYTLSTFTVGLYCNNMIVYIYLKEDEKKAILTYVDFWGKRIDVHTTISDIPHLVDMPRKFNDELYRTFKVNAHEENLKLSLRFAKHFDKKGMELLFGKLP